MYVKQFTSRPVMVIKPSNGREFALTYVDLIQRYGEELDRTKLSQAYRRAGVAFRHQLQQTFVVLIDQNKKIMKTWRSERLFQQKPRESQRREQELEQEERQDVEGFNSGTRGAGEVLEVLEVDGGAEGKQEEEEREDKIK